MNLLNFVKLLFIGSFSIIIAGILLLISAELSIRTGNLPLQEGWILKSFAKELMTIGYLIYLPAIGLLVGILEDREEGIEDEDK